ncbi:MAG: glycoside hydrolase family 30 protein [Coraliomargaritaceae bacterium]
MQISPKFNSRATIYTTAKDTEQRLKRSNQHTFQGGGTIAEGTVAIYVNPASRFQTLLGIGGSITDASAEVFSKLSPEKQEELLTAYFDAEIGNGYNLCRSPIHSADFSSESFTYIEEGDKKLESFSIQRDRRYRIPMIKRAMRLAGQPFTFYASPWSAPAFMKDNKNMLYGGKLLPEYRDTWALYYAKFIQAYEKEGIPVWGITIQNEPAAVQRWESMNYTAEEERDFLKNHLGPTLQKEGLGDKKIVVWDHNRDLITHRADTIFGDPDAAQYAWGIGFHWYETWTGGESLQRNLTAIQQAYPDKQLLFTEGCNEGFDADRYQYWPNAERYGEAMIRDFNVGTVGWTDWNLLLDQRGGPNHVGNFCFAPIHADLTTGELVYTPSYYYIGHFSRFIRPGAQRIGTTTNRSFLLATSFINKDGGIATVVMNKTDNEMDYDLHLGDKHIRVKIPARAMQTVLY